ncbi:hypothetical protein GJ496_008884 [Pomphorhynchus laevis]|nr:hypothetical protein GJ496_008884 [Pomphorhynchus laevis]
MIPAPHSEELPVPNFNVLPQLSLFSSDEVSSLKYVDEDKEFQLKPHLIDHVSYGVVLKCDEQPLADNNSTDISRIFVFLSVVTLTTLLKYRNSM